MCADLSTSAKSDSLKDTVDYVSINQIVKQQMAISSNLLENVVQRILDSIASSHPNVLRADVEVFKINPPIKSVSIILIILVLFFDIFLINGFRFS